MERCIERQKSKGPKGSPCCKPSADCITRPTTRTQRVPRVPDREEVRTRDQRMKQRQKKNFDSHHGARTLPVLKTGDRVWIPTRQKEGIPSTRKKSPNRLSKRRDIYQGQTPLWLPTFCSANYNYI